MFLPVPESERHSSKEQHYEVARAAWCDSLGKPESQNWMDDERHAEESEFAVNI
ncbi:MAG: hypothetical protein POH28_11075 [Acidocella sp.]|nr:hypothetical protein [Acidocella sp.]